MKAFHVAVFFLFLGVYLPSFAQPLDGSSSSDEAITVPKPYEYNKKKVPFKIDSKYLTMRDGTKIAVDIYMPKAALKGEKLPVIFHQTRYWRRIELKKPIKWIAGRFADIYGQVYLNFIRNGYVVVNVDTRGSGASFGHRTAPWSKEMIDDAGEILDWIAEQPWFNGNIGAFGLSYTGTMAEMTLINKHPTIKAIMPMYAMFDIYGDVGFPGGIRNDFVTRDWNRINKYLDRNELPIESKKLKRIVKGVAPVKGAKAELKLAIEEHKENVDVYEYSKEITFRDDGFKNSDVESMTEFSPYAYVDLIKAHGIPVYSYSGWLDGANQHSAIKRFLTIDNPGSKLTLGPWAHGGMYNIGPGSTGKTKFDHFSEVLKFMNYHVKGEKNGLDQEAPIHYFTMMEDSWHEAETWPPKPVETRSYYLNENQTLTPTAPTTKGIDSYKVDNSTGSGNKTRWNSVTLDFNDYDANPNRESIDSTLLVYETEALTEYMEVTGHPMVKMYVSADVKDAHLIVYLEDVGPDGHVHYITEGQIRALHRKVCVEHLPFNDVVPYHSCDATDATPLQPNEVTEFSFDLLPVSWLFKEGHKIRVSIAGADKDHFEIINPDPHTLTFHRDPVHLSRIELPIVSFKEKQ